MRATRFLSRVVCQVALVGLIATVPAGDAISADGPGGPGATEKNESRGDQARLDLQIVRGKTIIKHPGLIADGSTDIVLKMQEQDRQHQIKMRFEKADAAATSFRVQIEYSDNGRVLLRATKTASQKKWVTLRKGSVKVKVKIDPDDLAKGNIEITPTDDPLGGIG